MNRTEIRGMVADHVLNAIAHPDDTVTINNCVDRIMRLIDNEQNTQLSRIEKYLEFDFLKYHFGASEQRGAQLAEVFQKYHNAMDIKLRMELENIMHDQKLIGPRFMELGRELMAEQLTPGTKFKWFKYIDPTVETPSDEKKSTLIIQ